MRILLADENREPFVMDAAVVAYDSDIFDVKAENGSYDMMEERPVEGLWIEQDKTIHTDCFFIRNVRRSKCEEVIKELTIKGYVDLRELGIVEHFDFDK